MINNDYTMDTEIEDLDTPTLEGVEVDEDEAALLRGDSEYDDLDNEDDDDVDSEEEVDEPVEEVKKTRGRKSTKTTATKKTTSKKKDLSDITVLDDESSETIANLQKSDDGNLPDDRKLKIYKDLAEFTSEDRPLVKTNILSLDLVLGELFRGEVIELSSPAGVGKSTLMMQLCKNIVSGKFEPHNPYGKVAYIDVEGGVNGASLEKLGLTKYKGKQFQLLQNVNTYEKLEKVLEILVDSEERFDAIIIDSITDVIPGELYAKSIDQVTIGLGARYMTTLIQKFKPLVRKSGTTLWLVNQMRVKSQKVGYKFVMTEDAAGPNIVAFAPDVRLKLAKGEAIKQKATTANGDVEVKIGTMSEIWATKNRANNVDIRVSMPIIYGRGISDVMTMKNVLYKKGFLSIGGASHTLTMPDEEPVKFQGSAKFLEYLKGNVYEIRDKLEKHGYWKLIDLGEVAMI